MGEFGCGLSRDVVSLPHCVNRTASALCPPAVLRYEEDGGKEGGKDGGSNEVGKEGRRRNGRRG